MLSRCWFFFQLGALYVNIRHDPRVNIISSGKVSIVSNNIAGGSGAVLRPAGVLEGGAL